MSDDDFQDVRRLIALKRYERPPENYEENFLEEFHRRQRSEFLQQSSRGLFWERLSTYIGELGRAKWAYAGAAACALFASLFALGTQFNSDGSQGTFAMPGGNAFAPSGADPSTSGATGVVGTGTNTPLPVAAPQGNPPNAEPYARPGNLDHRGHLVPVGSSAPTRTSGSGITGVSVYREF